MLLKDKYNIYSLWGYSVKDRKKKMKKIQGEVNGIKKSQKKSCFSKS